MNFDGETYVAARDKARLTEQLGRVRWLMLDGEPRTLSQIREVTGDNEVSISARLRDLRKAKFGGHIVERNHISNGLYTYQINKA